MTNAFLARFEQLAHRNFARAGLAERGTYTAPGSEPVAVDFYIDRDVQFMAGEQITGPLTVIELIGIQGIGGGVVTCGDESWSLVRTEKSDEATGRWIVE